MPENAQGPLPGGLVVTHLVELEREARKAGSARRKVGGKKVPGLRSKRRAGGERPERGERALAVRKGTKTKYRRPGEARSRKSRAKTKASNRGVKSR